MRIKLLSKISDKQMRIEDEVNQIKDGTYYFIDDSFIWYGSSKDWKMLPESIELIDFQEKSKGTFKKHNLPSMTSSETNIAVVSAAIWTK